MKFSVIAYLFLLTACETNDDETIAKFIKEQKLLNEQRVLKDSKNNLSERIWDYTSRGVYDSAETLKIRTGVLVSRLKDIQASLDSMANIR